MKPYILDMRKVCLQMIDNAKDTLLAKDYYSKKKFLFEDKDTTNIIFKDLKVGHRLWFSGTPPYSNLQYGLYEIEVTHIYGGVLFFKFPNNPEVPETYCPFNSFAGATAFYPYEIITMTGFNLCCMPRPSEKVKITIDDDLSTIGSYSSTKELI